MSGYNIPLITDIQNNTIQNNFKIKPIIIYINEHIEIAAKNGLFYINIFDLKTHKTIYYNFNI